MTPDQFCYWLQGLMELQNPKTLNETQVQSIKDHLVLVFKKVTPAIVNKDENSNLAELLKNFEEIHKKPKEAPIQKPFYPQWPMPLIDPSTPEYGPPHRVTCENTSTYC